MSTIAPFMTIGQVPVYKLYDGSYCFLAGMDIDGDGSGGNLENDPDFQPTTSLRNPDGSSLNSRAECGIVLPGKLMRAFQEIALGCRAYVRSGLTGLFTDAVVAVGGPDDKIGEAFIATAKMMGIPTSPTTGGDQQPFYFYRFWPAQAATVNGKTYHLQPLA